MQLNNKEQQQQEEKEEMSKLKETRCIGVSN